MTIWNKKYHGRLIVVEEIFLNLNRPFIEAVKSFENTPKGVKRANDYKKKLAETTGKVIYYVTLKNIIERGYDIDYIPLLMGQEALPPIIINGQEFYAPPQVLIRPRDERGYPVLYTNAVKKDGSPDFLTIDRQKVHNCAKGKLCGICGGFLLSTKTYPLPVWRDYVYFIGGPHSCERSGIFADPPMHEDCARFAMRVCPWMILGRYRRIGNDPEQHHEGAMFVGERPIKFQLLRATSFRADSELLFHASYLNAVVEQWNPAGPMPTGEQMTEYFRQTEKELAHLVVRQMLTQDPMLSVALLGHKVANANPRHSMTGQTLDSLAKTGGREALDKALALGHQLNFRKEKGEQAI